MSHSHIIQLLEALGKDGQVGAYTDAQLEAATAGIALDPALRDALLRRDTVALNRLLKGRTNVMLFLVPAEPESPAESDGESETDGEGERKDSPEQPAARAIEA